MIYMVYTADDRYITDKIAMAMANLLHCNAQAMIQCSFITINLLPFWPFIDLYVLQCNVNLAQKVIESEQVAMVHA